MFDRANRKGSMQRICPVCETANRPNARYCRKCATPLPTHEAPYAQTQIFVPSESLPVDGAEEAGPFSQPTRPIGLDDARREARNANRRVIIGFATVALVLSAAFWWKQRMQDAPAPSAAATATGAAAAPAPSPSPPAAVSPVAAVRPTQVGAPTTATAAPPTRPAAKARAPRARASAPTRVASAPVPAPAPVPTPPPSAPVASVPKPAAAPPPPASPSQACSGKNFLSMAICITDQCGKPQFANHPQCVRLREEARRVEEERQLGGN